jgi:iron complex transport system substrate-binding protein
MTRRMITRTTVLLCAAVTATGLAACSSDDDSGTPDSSGTTAQQAVDYPVTFHNSFGDSTVTQKPKRVAALGWSDQALATELGADVVLAPQSYSSFSVGPNGDAGGPKMLPYLHPDAEPTWFDPMHPDIEAIATSDPDVILATSAFHMDDDMWRKLNDIAPVVGYEHAVYEADPKDSVARIGQALGEPEKTGELVDKADKAVADLKEELPGLQGKTYVYGQYRGTEVAAITAADNATARFMSLIGLTPEPGVAGLGGDGAGGFTSLSMENIDMVDAADLFFMTYQGEVDRNEFEKNPAVSRLPIMKTGYKALDKETATALQDPNVVAVPWLIDQLKDALTKVAG